MQTKIIKNADTCAGILQELETNYADKLCLPSGQGHLHFGSSTEGLSTEFVCRACLHDLGMQTKFVYVLKSLSKVCKVVYSRNADKVCLEITSLFLMSDSIIEFSELKSSHPQRAQV